MVSFGLLLEKETMLKIFLVELVSIFKVIMQGLHQLFWDKVEFQYYFDYCLWHLCA